MSQTKKTYSLTKFKQLIDLNGDSENFDLTFTVTCNDSSPYQLLVVDQTTLDNSEILDYKDVTGVMSGSVIADKNVFQNHFLILKSENPCEVHVEIVKQELPKTPDSVIQQLSNPYVNNIPPQNMSPPSKDVNWFKIGLIVAVILGGCLLLWYLYKRKKTDSVKNMTDNTQEVKNSFSFNTTNKNNDCFMSTPHSPQAPEAPPQAPPQAPPHSPQAPPPSPQVTYPSSLDRSQLHQLSSESSVDTNLPKKSTYKPASYSYKPTSYKPTSYKPTSYKPTKNKNSSYTGTKQMTNLSPDIMSNISSDRSVPEGASTLLNRLRKFAR